MARMPKPALDLCRCCEAELPAGFASCQRCGTTRNSTWAVMVAEHVAEHVLAGMTDPVEVLAAMEARGIYKTQMTPQFIAQQMRLLTKDTSTLARQIAKARASRVMLDVLETGDAKDKIAVLKGIQVLGDVVEHKGEVTTRFVIETHDGAPPRQESEL